MTRINRKMFQIFFLLSSELCYGYWLVIFCLVSSVITGLWLGSSYSPP
ncbi:hypothetical protein LINGRAHAP2_LOCUS22048 [Linum grandiflorum]